MNFIPPEKKLKNFISDLKDGLKTFYYYRELPSFKKLPDFNTSLQSGGGHPKSPLVVISNHLPRYDKSSADLRLLNILKIVESFNRFQVHYLYLKTTADDAIYKKVLSADTQFYRLDPESAAFKNRIETIRPGYIWITSLWQIDYFRLMTDLVDELNFDKVVVDTVDFHAKEYERKFSATNDARDQRLAKDFIALESRLYPMADSLVVVSEDEKKDIQNELDNIGDVDIVPNIHHVEERFRPLAKRSHICFLGNFGNAHNLDAAKYFIEEIFPLILKKIPSIEFHVLGNLSDRFKDQMKHPQVKVIGRINDIRKAVSHYRLFVCPMRFGAGLKGKVGMAMETGVPTVSTLIGAEGFPVVNGDHCFIADDPGDFSEKCIQLLTDDKMWNAVANRAAEMIDSNFGTGTVKRIIADILQLD